MTTNKRFKNVEENLDWGTVQYFTYHDEKITDKEIEKLVNHLLNQNEELKKENKQLKLQNQRLDIDIKNNQLAYYDLENENEQLKNENQKLDEKIRLLTMDLIKTKSYEQLEKELNRIKNENEQLKSFKQRVFDLIDKTIEEETQIAENIEEVTHKTRPYAKAVNRITIKTLENLKWELQE